MDDHSIPRKGTICRRELATKDLEKAAVFYTRMFGWNLEKRTAAETEYSEILIDGEAVGAIKAIDEDWGPELPPSHWCTFIAVENADETVESILSNGGSLRRGPFDAVGVGRIAMVADPAGAPFAIVELK